MGAWASMGTGGWRRPDRACRVGGKTIMNESDLQIDRKRFQICQTAWAGRGRQIPPHCNQITIPSWKGAHNSPTYHISIHVVISQINNKSYLASKTSIASDHDQPKQQQHSCKMCPATFARPLHLIIISCPPKPSEWIQGRRTHDCRELSASHDKTPTFPNN